MKKTQISIMLNRKGSKFFLLLILLQCCHLLSWIAIECVSMGMKSKSPSDSAVYSPYIILLIFCAALWEFLLLFYFFFSCDKKDQQYIRDLNHIIVIVISVYRHWLYVIVIHGEYDGDMRYIKKIIVKIFLKFHNFYMHNFIFYAAILRTCDSIFIRFFMTFFLLAKLHFLNLKSSISFEIIRVRRLSGFWTF